MSKFIQANKRQVAGQQNANINQDQTGGTVIHAVVRNPLSQAAVGLASMMLASTAATAQDATAPQQPKPNKKEPTTTGQQAQETTTLPQINVRSSTKPRRRPTPQAPAPAPAPAVAAPSTDTSYQLPGSAGINRIPTALRDTPQSIAVVPQTVIREQNVSNIRDALRNVAGVTFRAGEGGNQGDTPYIRGFSAQNDVFRDGIRDPGWYTRDAFATDAVEVYKGPSSVLFGRGSTGGAINLTSKLPEDRAFVETTLSGNTGPGGRATLDANGRINENTTARVVAMGQRYDIPDRDHVEENRWGFAPSIKTKLGTQTTNTLSYIYQHDQSIPDYGIPLLSVRWGIPRPPAPVARNTWYGILSGPTPDVERVDASILTNKFEHQFNPGLKVVNTSRYSYVDRMQINVFPEPNANVPPPPNLNANWTMNRARINVTNSMLANNTDFIAKFNTWNFEHTVATGFEVNYETRNFKRNGFTTSTTNFLNPNAWRPGGTPINPTSSQLTYGDATDLAIYFADQIKLNRYFEVLGSIRAENYRFDQLAPLAAQNVQNLSRTDNLVSWRAGAVFHPTPNSSLYGMHGTSFNPSADNLSIGVNTALTAISQANLPPEKNETTEFGAKVDVLDDKLTLQSAIFRTDKTNLRVPADPISTAVQVLAGKVRADGFEASATGYITKQWQIITSYTYINARIISTTIPAQLNNEPMNTPAQAYSLWTTYDITPQIQVGGGAFYNSEVWGDLPNTGLIPGWWRYDLMAAYKFNPKTTLQFNLYNVTDKLYYGSAYSNWAVPAPGRLAMLTLRVRY